MTQMHQALACTSIEAMIYARFKPHNLEAILEMIRNHPTAAHQLLASNAQLKSLEDTFSTIKANLESREVCGEVDWRVHMQKLVDVIKEMRKNS